MFSRVQYETWHLALPVVAFALTFAVFTYYMVRALRMRKQTAEAMARLPLEPEELPKSN